MATATETTVSRLLLVTEEQGADAAIAKLDKLAGAQEGVVSATVDQQKVTLSVQRTVDQLTRSLDANAQAHFKAEQAKRQFSKADRDLTTAVAQGFDPKEAERLRGLAAARRDNRIAQLTLPSAAPGIANDNAMSANMRRFQQQVLREQLTQGLTQYMTGGSLQQVVEAQGFQTFEALKLNPEGIKASVKDIGASLLSLVTPTNVAVAALVTGAAVIGKAWYDAAHQMDAFRQALTGQGRGTNATVSDLNAIAQSAAEAGHVSKSAAADMVAAYASTGKIGTGVFADLVKIQKDYADTTGQELPDATKALAQAFADPTKGADMLAQQLGTLDDKTVQLIRTQQESGDRIGAQKTLFEAMRPALVNHEEQLTAIGKAWEYIKNAASDAFNSIGHAMAPSLQEQADKARAALDAAKKEVSERNRVSPGSISQRDINRVESLYRDALDAQERLRADQIQRDIISRDAKARDDAARVGQITRSALPDETGLADLKANRKFMQDALVDPVVLEKLGVTAEQAQKALAMLDSQVENFKTGVEKMRQDQELEIRSIQARTLEDRASVAAEQARVAVIRAGKTEAEASVAAEGARNKVIAEANRQAQDTLRASRNSASLVGLTPYQRTQQEITNRYRDLREQNGGGGSISSGTSFLGVSGSTMQQIVGLTTQLAQSLGVSAKDLLTVMSYETGGTFSPDKMGPGGHQGLIQMGKTEQAAYGLHDFNNLPDQFAAIANYFKARGARPGDDLMQLYSIVNAGGRDRFGVSDAANGGAWGTVADKVNSQMAGHAAKAQAALASYPANDNGDMISRHYAGGQSANSAYDEAERLDRAAAAQEAINGPLKEANQNLDAQIALLERQQSTFGQSTAAVTAAAAEQQLLNQYLAAGVNETTIGADAWQKLTDNIHKYALRAGDAAAADEKFRDSQKTIADIENTGKDALKGFISDLAHGKSGAEALTNALEKLGDKLLDLAMNSLFNKDGAGGLGSLLSLFGGKPAIPAGKIMDPITGGLFHTGGLVGGANGNTRSVHPSVFYGAPRYHSGLRPDEVPAILQKGEWVLSKNDVSGIKQGGSMPAANGNAPRVTVINNGPTQASATQNSDGSIDVIVDSLENHMADRAARGRGALYKASTSRADGRALRG